MNHKTKLMKGAFPITMGSCQVRVWGDKGVNLSTKRDKENYKILNRCKPNPKENDNVHMVAIHAWNITFSCLFMSFNIRHLQIFTSDTS